MLASFHSQLPGPFTIHIDDTGAMSDEAIRDRKDIVDADAKTNFLNYLDIGSQMEIGRFEDKPYFVGIFCIQIVFDALGAWFLKIFRGDLDQVRDGGL